MKASVRIVTYNHEQFIAQAIDSALMQETDFPYELVIGEDCSTDGTRDIVIDYQKRYPDKIRLLLPERNLGMHENAKQTRRACRGEYVALLEGDDYWTCPHKLQKQVDFLDSHPECVSCFHPVWKVYEDGRREPHIVPPQRKPIYELRDLMESNFIPTCSTVFRAGLIGDLPEWYYALPNGDRAFHVLNAQHGKIGCIDHVMGVYRIHKSGVTSTRTPAENLRAYAVFYDRMNLLFPSRFEGTIRRSMAGCWEQAADQVARGVFEQGSVEAAESNLAKVLSQWPEDLPFTEAWRAKVLGRVYVLFAFAAHDKEDPASVRSCLPKAIACDPALLRNLGVWSIGAEALLGHSVVGWLRRLAHRRLPADH